MLHHTCTVWYTMYQSALGGMVIYERFQAKVDVESGRCTYDIRP